MPSGRRRRGGSRTSKHGSPRSSSRARALHSTWRPRDLWRRRRRRWCGQSRRPTATNPWTRPSRIAARSPRFARARTTVRSSAPRVPADEPRVAARAERALLDRRVVLHAGRLLSGDSATSTRSGSSYPKSDRAAAARAQDRTRVSADGQQERGAARVPEGRQRLSRLAGGGAGPGEAARRSACKWRSSGTSPRSPRRFVAPVADARQLRRRAPRASGDSRRASWPRRAAAGGEAVAITFHPHPMAVLRPEQAPALITSLRDKLRLLGGCRHRRRSCCSTSRRAFAALSAEEFVERFIVGRLRRDARGRRPQRELRARAARQRRVARRRSASASASSVEVVGPVARRRATTCRARRCGARSPPATCALAADAARTAAPARRPRRARATARGAAHRLSDRQRARARRDVVRRTASTRCACATCDGIVCDSTASRTSARNPDVRRHAPRTLEVLPLRLRRRSLRRARAAWRSSSGCAARSRFRRVEALVAQIARDVDDARAILARASRMTAGRRARRPVMTSRATRSSSTRRPRAAARPVRRRRARSRLSRSQVRHLIDDGSRARRRRAAQAGLPRARRAIAVAVEVPPSRRRRRARGVCRSTCSTRTTR